METLLYIVLASLAIMVASLAGVFTVWKRLDHIIRNNLSLWVSFSSGVFLIVAVLLLGEAFEHNTLFQTLVFFAAGAFVILGLFRFLPEFHHHHTEEEGTGEHSHGSAKRILTSDAIHNIADGILLGAAFATNTTFGFITAVSIFIHEFVQEISEFFVLKHAGYSTSRALWINFLVSSTIFIGALLSYFLLETAEALEGPILAIAAGSFFIVVFHDLIPASLKGSLENKMPTKHAVMFIAGMALMIALNYFAGHAETEEEIEVNLASQTVAGHYQG